MMNQNNPQMINIYQSHHNQRFQNNIDQQIMAQNFKNMNLNTDNQNRNNNFQKNRMNSIIDIKAKNNNNYNHNLFKISKVNNDYLNKNKKENENRRITKQK